jgi:hypothetical protein
MKPRQLPAVRTLPKRRTARDPPPMPSTRTPTTGPSAATPWRPRRNFRQRHGSARSQRCLELDGRGMVLRAVARERLTLRRSMVEAPGARPRRREHVGPAASSLPERSTAEIDFAAYDRTFPSWFPERLSSRTTILPVGFAVAQALLEIDAVSR